MEKKDWVIDSLKASKMDGLVCFLPENVLFLSGYWPNTGHSAILFPVEGEAALIVPQPDTAFIPSDWKGEVFEYGVHVKDGPGDHQIAKLLRKSMGQRDMLSARIGCERSFQNVAGSHVGGEVTVPGLPLFKLLEEAMPDVILECQTPLIRKLRMRKTPSEIKFLRICNEIAGHALEMAKERLSPGMRETEVAAIIESAIMNYGVGHAGIQRARGFAFAVSGPNAGGVYAWGPYNISTDRILQSGDLVLIELDSYADGYWSDITRTFVVGEPDQKQKDVMGIILNTIDSVIEALEPGMEASAVNALARKLIEDSGYGDYFPHTIGHGVGFGFHEMPYLVPSSDSVLEPGMVLAIEPGIYIPDWGGVRVEENILITEDGKISILSDFERGF